MTAHGRVKPAESCRISDNQPTVDGLSVSRDETSATIAAIVEEVEVEPLANREETSPDGMVTIVFTDVERSTETLERLGEDRWFQLMLSHNDIVRTTVSGHRGRVIKSQGDGFMMTFASAAAALECSIELQRAFARHNEHNPNQRLPVRIGLHTGNIFQLEDDVLGKAVVMAARITGKARGGEILVSSASREYTARLGRWRYDPRGQLRLKGLAGREQVYSLDWA